MYLSNEFIVVSDGASVSVENGVLIHNDIELTESFVTASQGDSIKIKLGSSANNSQCDCSC